MTSISTDSTSVWAQASALLQQVYQNKKDSTAVEELASTSVTSVSTTSTSSSPSFVSGDLSLDGSSMSVLLDSQSVQDVQPADQVDPATSFDSWFSGIDTDNDGAITKTEFEAAAPEGTTTEQADALFASLDTTGSGSVTKEQLASALASVSGADTTSSDTASWQEIGGGGGSSSGSSSSSTTTTTQVTQNADGSVTTTSTTEESDGTEYVTVTTTPASGSGSASGSAGGESAAASFFS